MSRHGLAEGRTEGRGNGIFIAALIMGLIGLVLIGTVVASPVGIALLGLALVIGVLGYFQRR
jgi:hypothetical protein